MSTLAISHQIAFTGKSTQELRFYSMPINLLEPKMSEPTAQTKNVSEFTAEKALREQLFKRIDKIVKLDDNWDGYGAIKPNVMTMNNCKTFLNGISIKVLQYLDEQDIYPMTYGTIIMEFNKGNNLLSVEFGESKVGFFTEFMNSENIVVESVDLNKDGLSYELFDAVKSFLRT
jgi:hypothetical protein